MHALTNHYLPYSILQTYPDCSGYHGNGLSIQEIGRDREFTDFQISECVFINIMGKIQAHDPNIWCVPHYNSVL